MTAFEHTTLAQRVLFGTGQARSNFRAELERTGARRVMVIAAPSEAVLAQTITAETSVVLHWDDVLPHVPIDKADAARAAAKIHDVDLVVCIGGGSTTGLAKAVALTTGLPIVAIPTTYAGSEATNVWGLTEQSRKTTGIDDRVLPRTIIYDAELTATLPSSLSVASGLNALAHCIDSMWAPRTDPIDQAFAAEGIRALGQGLPAIKDAAGRALAGREETLYGAYLSAVAFSSAGSGMHHKICHVLGGAYNLPHAQTHAVVLPYVLAYLAPAAPAAAERIAGAFGSTTAVDGLNDLRRRLDAPTSLADHGFAEESIDEAVELILPSIPPSTPRAVTPSNLRTLLRAAWSGEHPSTGLFP